MRRRMLTLFAVGVLLAACEPTRPEAVPPAAESTFGMPPPVPEAGADMTFTLSESQPPESEQARRAAEEAQRDFERRAATVGEDVAAMSRHADEAYRQAQPRSPEPGPPQRTPPQPAPAQPAPALPTPPVATPGG